MATQKFLTLNRVTGVYKIGNKAVTFKEFWFMAKYLINTKKGCKVKDDKYILMYQC